MIDFFYNRYRCEYWTRHGVRYARVTDIETGKTVQLRVKGTLLDTLDQCVAKLESRED